MADKTETGNLSIENELSNSRQVVELFKPHAREIKELFKPGIIPSDEDVAKVLANVSIEVTEETTVMKRHAGPMPSPETMEGYNKIFPGAAEQLFDQFRKEQEHRQNWENKILNLENDERKRKDYIAFSLAFIGLSLCAYLIYKDSFIIGAVLAGVIVLGGGAMWLGKQFFAKHNSDGTEVNLGKSGT